MLTKQEKFDKVNETMTSIRQKHKLFGIVDIVLNHTANNSQWIDDHPEACYSTDEVPRLYPAYLLDAVLVQVSKDYSQGNVSWCPSAPFLRSE